MKLYPTSIRAKLTLTAVAVMGVLFVVLGAVVEVVGRQEILAGVDADLDRHAAEFIQIHKDMLRHRPPFGPGGPDGGMGPGGPNDHGPSNPRNQGPGNVSGQNPRGPNDRGPDGRGPFDRGPSDQGRGGPGGGRPPIDFQRAVQRVGDPLLAIQPRFVSITPGPPFARPDMMVPYDKSLIPLAERRGVVFSMAEIGDEKVRLITKLAVDDDGRKWIVQYPHPLKDVDKALDELNRTLLTLLPIGLGMTAFACLFLMKRIMRPIREITTTAESIGAEDLSGRLTVAGSDEFARLAGTMNGMLGRIEVAFAAQAKAMERLEGILKQQRRFTADASHELKTPLAVIKANTGLLLHGSKLDADTGSSIEAIDSAATRMSKLVQGLMVLARSESGHGPRNAETFNLVLAVQNAIDQVHRPESKEVQFESSLEDAPITGCENDVERVFVNLVDNACRYTPPDGSIRLTVNIEDDFVVVQVSDNGAGIAPEHLEHLFDRFYRVDSARSSESGGTGLGLAICKSIVDSHGGTISVQSELENGTMVTVRLPIARATSVAG
ncbi:MAG: HAMP domain-containing sensor histidine kinase [Fimbriimonas sp.]|nr:HAMP domain-containing sensor histidine kinase [Fimbriimonas sp.]